MVQIYSTATEYTANAITLKRGTISDVLAVYVHHAIDPNAIPAFADFTQVTLVTTGPLQEGTLIDILAKIGPGVPGSTPAVPAGLVLAPGIYQRWCGLRTADEFIIRAVDEVEII